jgi:hypothetical protein
MIWKIFDIHAELIIMHPASNTFFLQFPNCLAYENMEECLEKLIWALEHDPTPLTDEYAHKFTWEGANERLFEASAISRGEARERLETGQSKSDTEAAWLHIEMTKRGQIVAKFFGSPSSQE